MSPDHDPHRHHPDLSAPATRRALRIAAVLATLAAVALAVWRITMLTEAKPTPTATVRTDFPGLARPQAR